MYTFQKIIQTLLYVLDASDACYRDVMHTSSPVTCYVSAMLTF
jgi:hypothetical protein